MESREPLGLPLCTVSHHLLVSLSFSYAAGSQQVHMDTAWLLKAWAQKSGTVTSAPFYCGKWLQGVGPSLVQKGMRKPVGGHLWKWPPSDRMESPLDDGVCWRYHGKLTMKQLPETPGSAHHFFIPIGGERPSTLIGLATPCAHSWPVRH